MKHYNILFISISTLAALVSCTREELQETDSAIRFSVTATAGQAGLPPTRTSYGDLAASVSGLTKTILWAEGDRVSLWSPDAVVMQSGAVTHPAASYSVGEQGVSPVTGSTPLQWGTADTHVFYGKYPDPTWASAAPHANDAFAAQDPASASFQCWLPSTVTITPSAGTNAYSEDMAYCYMTAYASVPRNAAVDMVFKQAVSAFHITVPYDLSEHPISKLELSSASHRLNGAFTVDIAATSTFNVSEDDLTDADRKVSLEFSSPLELSPSPTLEVTLFTCPVEMNDLTLSLTTSTGMILKMPFLTAAGDSLSFPAGKYFDIFCKGAGGSGMNVFTVDSLGLKVIFSPGNLQYTKSTDQWSFMEPQYSTVEADGQDVGDNYANQDVVSLFGWGTSGYHEKYPYMTSTEYDDYGPAFDYNTWTWNDSFDRPEWDWGQYNTISNGDGYSWRTLGIKEYLYVINKRKIGDSDQSLCALAQVAGVPGLVLFPDNYKFRESESYRFYRSVWDEYWGYWDSDPGTFSDNIIDAGTWMLMEFFGCVFLPAAGQRWGTSVSMEDSDSQPFGVYWSSTYDEGIYIPSFERSNWERQNGRSVRLVRNVNRVEED